MSVPKISFIANLETNNNIASINKQRIGLLSFHLTSSILVDLSNNILMYTIEEKYYSKIHKTNQLLLAIN